MIKKEVIKTADSVEKAVKLACEELNLVREEVSVEVLEMPKKGFFGLGKVDAKVKVISKTNIVDKLDVVRNYLYDLLSNMGLDNFEIIVDQKSDKKVILTLMGENLGLVIGKRGDTLNALQTLCSVATNMSGGEYFNVIIDVGNYRKTREKVLVDLATKISKTVLKNKRKIVLEPMDAYERKIIHETIQSIEGVDSISKGAEPHRYIVVFYVNNNHKKRNNIYMK